MSTTTILIILLAVAFFLIGYIAHLMQRSVNNLSTLVLYNHLYMLDNFEDYWSEAEQRKYASHLQRKSPQP